VINELAESSFNNNVEARNAMIPFNKPFIIGKELYFIAQAVLSGHLAGDGVFTKRCHTWLENTYGAQKSLLTHSCTAALEIAAILTEVGPGDEVILPSFTFVSTANAFVLRGAHLVFADIREDTFNMDENLLPSLISPRTKVIVPVHYGGVGCEMDAINALAQKHDCVVVEDAAQAANARWREHWLGTLGHLGCYSFHETKNFISGEGGALLVNDDRYNDRAEIIREKGTDRSQFFRGQVDKYTWVDIGSSYLPSEIVAAFLAAQFEEAERITTKRIAIHNRYTAGFADLIASGRIGTQIIPDYCQHNGHLFCILMRDLDERTRLIAYLKKHGVMAVFHYMPLHLSLMGKRHGSLPKGLPVTESVADRLVRLPCFFGLQSAEQDRIIDLVHSFTALRE
jgi:dTDP-4-amino-4,6-dideoxygalactose transaminase